MSNYHYQNSRGEEIDLCRSPLWTATFNNLRSYAYERVENNGVYYGHTRRKAVEKELQLQCKSSARGEFLRFREEFFRIVNYDVEAGKTGRLSVGDYYANGVFAAESIDTYDDRRGLWISTMPFFMPKEVWRRELPSIMIDGEGVELLQIGTIPEDQTNSADAPNPEESSEDDTIESETPDTTTADYPLDYPHNFTTGRNEYEIDNSSAFPSPFRMVIYGYCKNPTVTIGGHIYALDMTIQAGHRVIIDSVSKEIFDYNAVNHAENVFARQNHDDENYIFTPIQPGRQLLYCKGIPRIVLTIIEERSSPKWI